MTSGDFYDFNEVCELLEQKEYLRVLEYVQPFADAGVSDAQAQLGTMYLLGIGVPLDYLEAERWLAKAAYQDNPVAWNNLGTLYACTDPLRSKQCYKRAVELGFLMAAPLAE